MIQTARQRITLQIESLEGIAQALDENFERATHLLSAANKIVSTGLGKSGFIARKLAATLSSLRMPSIYLHPVDALHGDSGILEAGDCMVAFSKSGETPEVLRLIDHVRGLGICVVAITSRLNSAITQRADATLYAHIASELDELNLVPTASTTAALVMADILALSAAEHRGVAADALRASHPGGAIGASLLRLVDEVMHSGAALPTVTPDATLKAALTELSQKGLGAVCVNNNDGVLVGLLTDGDVRRFVQAGGDAEHTSVQNVMTTSPVTISPGATLHEAFLMMEQRTRQLSVLPVVDGTTCVGLVRLHDIVRVNLT